MQVFMMPLRLALIAIAFATPFFGPFNQAFGQTCEELFSSVSKPVYIERDVAYSAPHVHFAANDPSSFVRYTEKAADVVDNGVARRLPRHQGAEIFRTAISADGRLTAVGYDTTNITQLYNSATARLIGVDKWHVELPTNWNRSARTPDGYRALYAKEEIRDLDFSPDGRWLVAFSYHGEGRIYDFKNQLIIPTDIRTWSGGVTYSENGKSFFVGSREKRIFEVSLATGQVLQTIKGFESYTQGSGGEIHLLKDGTIVVASSRMIEWRDQTGRMHRTSSASLGTSGYMPMLSFHPSTREMIFRATAGEFAIANIHSTGSLRRSQTLEVDTHSPYASAVAMNRRLGIAAIGTSNNAPNARDFWYREWALTHKGEDYRGVVTLYDLATGQVMARLNPKTAMLEDRSSVSQIVFSPTERQVYVSHESGSVFLYDLP